MTRRIVPSFAVERSPPSVILEPTLPEWLQDTLQQAKQPGRSLRTTRGQKDYLVELLSSQSAIWTLCSMGLEKVPEAELREKQFPLVEAFQMIHIEAYVLYVDMLSPTNDMAFKLTQETIQVLMDFYDDVYLVNYGASIVNCPGKEAQLKQLQEEFAQAVNSFIFRANPTALEELDETGAGMLLGDEIARAKASILGLFPPKLLLHEDVFYSTQTVNGESSFSSGPVNFFLDPLETPMASWLNLESGFSLEPSGFLFPPLPYAERQNCVTHPLHAGQLQYLSLAGTTGGEDGLWTGSISHGV